MALRREELICMTKSTLWWCVWGILSWVWSLLFPMQKPKKHLQTLALTLNLYPPLLITSNKSDQNNVISSKTPSPYSSLFNAPLSTSFDRTMDDLIGSENGVYNVPDIDTSEMTQNSRPKPNLRKRAMQYQCRPPPPPMPLRSPSGDKLLVGAIEGFTRLYENGRLILTQESDPLDVESSDKEYLFEAHRENNRLRLNLVSHPTQGFCYPISKQVRKGDISEDEEAEVVGEEANKSEEKMKMRERKGKEKEVCLVDYEEEVENDDEVEDRRVGIASCWEIGGTSGSTISSSNNGDDDVGNGSSLMMMRCAVDAAAARSCGPRFDEPIPINPAVLAALFN